MVSIILPAYNERANLLLLIEEIRSALGRHEHEIIVADDASLDGTSAAVSGRNYSNVKVLSRQKDFGLANAICDGIKASSGEIVVVMDSDFNHQPVYLPQMLTGLSGFDCVSGSRFLPGGGMPGRFHYLSTKIFNRIVQWATRGKVSDHSYGFYAVKRGVLNSLDFGKIFWGHGDYCIRLMYYLQKSGASILEIPVVNGVRRYGRPNQAYIKHFFKYSLEVIRLVSREKVRVAR